MSEGQAQHVYTALCGALLVDAAARQAAEARVHQLSEQPGFVNCLVQLSLAPQVALEVRQLSAVVLKNFIRKHWCEEVDGFEPPLVTPDEKAAVRAALPLGLADASPRIRTAISVAIATIAGSDWPDEWGTLLIELLAPLEAAVGGDAAAAPAAVGALRCLELVAADLCEEHLHDGVYRLLPLLLQIVRAGASGGCLGRRDGADADDGGSPLRESARAVRVAHKLIDRIGMICDDQALVGSLTRGPLLQWAHAALHLLASAPTSASGSASALLIAALRMLRLLIGSWSAALKPCANDILPPLGALLSAAHTAHAALVGAADADDDEWRGADADSEGASLGPEALTTTLFDTLCALAASSRFYRLLLPALADLFYVAVGFLQVMPSSEAAWDADVAQYLQDEDEDTYAVSVRVAAQQFLVEFVDQYGKRALVPLCEAVQRRLADAERLRAAGDANWWRLREASILALSMGADGYVAAARRARKHGASAPPPPLSPDQLIGEFLATDLSPPAPPLLVVRALCTAARFCAAVGAPALRPYFHAAISALGADSPMILRLGACRALLMFAGYGPPSIMAAAAGPTLPLVAALLPQVHCAHPSVPCLEQRARLELPPCVVAQEEEDATLLVLEALSALLRADSAAAAAAEPALTPMLLSLWNARAEEALVVCAVVDAFGALATAPAAMGGLAERLLPTLAHVLLVQERASADRPARTDADADGDADADDVSDALAPALDLLDSVILRRWPEDTPLPPCATDEVLPTLLRLLTRATDTEVLRTGASCLGRFVRRGALGRCTAADAPTGADAAAWLGATHAMLRPGLRESAVEPVPPVICHMVRAAPALIGAHLGPLVDRLVPWLSLARLFGMRRAVVRLMSLVVHTIGDEPLLAALALAPPPPPPPRPDARPEKAEPPRAADPAEGGCATTAVLRAWVDVAIDELRPGTKKSLLLALLRLVTPARPQLCALDVADPWAAGVHVAGGAPRTTRAAARRRRASSPQRGEEMVPLISCVLRLVAQELLHGGHAGGAGRAWGGGVRSSGTSMQQATRASESVGPRGSDGSDDEIDEESDEEEGEEGDDDDGPECADGRSPFVPADELSVVDLSDLLYDDGADGISSSGDDADDGDEIEAALASSAAGDRSFDAVGSGVDLGAEITRYVHGLAAHLGGPRFEALSVAALRTPEEQAVVGHVLAQGAPPAG